MKGTTVMKELMVVIEKDNDIDSSKIFHNIFKTYVWIRSWIFRQHCHSRAFQSFTLCKIYENWRFCPCTGKKDQRKPVFWYILRIVHTAVSTAPLSTLKNFVVLSENEMFHGCRVLIEIRSSLSISKKRVRLYKEFSLSVYFLILVKQNRAS